MAQNNPQRKPNRLSFYSYSNTGYYFLTVCARNKEKLFGTIVGGGAFDAPLVQLSSIGKILEHYIQSTNRISGVFVDKYVIMPNHFHLILAIEQSESCNLISRANEQVPHVVGTIKRFCNRDLGENVFQRGYHDHVIRGEMDYQKIWSYIDDNPRRWKEDCMYVD